VLLVLATRPAGASQDPADGIPVPPAVQARDSQGRVTVRAVRIEEAPRVDALLHESIYQNVTPITGFIQQDPQEGQLATEPTLVWILFDASSIYVAARCRDSQPGRIVANDMRRDGRNVSQNDNISIVLDTFHDRRNGYEFLMNSIGGAWDTQITDERDANRDWNTVWTYASRRDSEGWTAEMAIPFRSLRYRGAGPQVWGINIRRNVRWKNELSYLSPVPRLFGARGILRLSQAATLVGLEAPPAALNLDVKPYAVGNVQADRAIDPRFTNDFNPDAGFDLKYGLTQSLTGDFTYRTDFAQVEDDDLQVNLTRFSLQFPEKREFFLEGQGMFAFGGVQTGTSTTATTVFGPSNTPLLFFSRQIGLKGNRAVPIDAGARLTGRVGRYSIGLLDIQTDRSREAAAVPTNFGVVRVKRDILERSYVGVLATRRAPGAGAEGENLAVGVDASVWLSRNLNVLGYYAGTRTPDRAGSDRSYRARFDYDADLFGLQIERQAVEEHFNPDVGFMRRTDFIESLAQLRVSRRPRSLAAIRKVNYEAGLDYITDGDRRLENRQARFAVRADMHSSDTWTIVYTRDFEFLVRPFEIVTGAFVPPGPYHSANVRGTYTLGTQRRVSGDVAVARGSLYGGDRTDLSYRGRVEVSPRLSVEPGVSFNWIDLPGARFTATLLTGRGMLSFSPRMFVAALVQYNSTNHLMTTNLRFRWEYRPGSDVFLVYSDGRDTFGRGFPILSNRGVTLKITRLFRF
jgi:Domain of unknown function (DUF5916)/Carbohydrate family 9 binding domain-like